MGLRFTCAAAAITTTARTSSHLQRTARRFEPFARAAAIIIAACRLPLPHRLHHTAQHHVQQQAAAALVHCLPLIAKRHLMTGGSRDMNAHSSTLARTILFRCWYAWPTLSSAETRSPTVGS
jgi:hypothetical protein